MSKSSTTSTHGTNRDEHRFDQALLDRIKDATDIVQLVQKSVELKKAGTTYKGLCPFHTEKSPSFTASPSRQTYHCFGCGVHGDAFKWLMETEGLTFVEAVRALARDTGIALPEFKPEAGESAEPLYAAMSKAAQFYADALFSPQGRGVHRYLTEKRGLTEETIRFFGLGAAFDTLPIDDQDAQERAGLLVKRDGGSLRPFFYKRVLFPIRDRRGRPIAFGGRTLTDGGQPKYLNTSETPLFNKGRELYGLYEAKKRIRETHQVVVVEGYFDKAMLHQHGLTNVVATCGTALTEEHVKTLMTLADRIVFCFDGDTAGRNAADRALERMLPLIDDEHTVSFAFLPEGEDPDTYVQDNGAPAMEALWERGQPLSQVLCAQFTPASGAALEERAGLSKEAGRVLGTITQAPALQGLLAAEIGRRIGIPIAANAPKASPRADGARPGAAAQRVVEPAPGRPRTPQPSSTEHKLVVVPVVKALLSFPGKASELPEVLRQSPVIGALAALLEKHRDVDLVLDAVRGDKTLFDYVNHLANGAINDRAVRKPDSIRTVFEAAAQVYSKLQRTAASDREADSGNEPP